jgi:hypothetical protein
VIESPKGRLEKSYDFLERESGGSKTAIPDSPRNQVANTIRLMPDQGLTDQPHADGDRHSGATRKAKHWSLQRSRTDSSANNSQGSLKVRGSRASDDISSHGRFIFSQFLTKCYSHEVLDYWDSTTQYIKLCKKRVAGDHAKELAKKCIVEYVLPGASQKLDLGEAVEDPLVSVYESNNFEPGTFDPTRKMLLKLLQGLRMDAIVSLGVKSPNAIAVSAFLEEEERKMHQLMFQRDVHPLLHKLRKSTTFAGNTQSGGSGLFIKTSQLFTGRRRSSGAAPGRRTSGGTAELPRTSSKGQI